MRAGGRSGAGALGVAAALALVAGGGVTAVATRSAGDAGPLPRARPASVAPLPEPSPLAAADVPLPPVPPVPLAAGVPAPPVAALAGLVVPDLLVRVPAPLTDEQVARLRAVRGVTAVAVLDTGVVRVGGQQARVAGVDPGEFRGFTPAETAGSDPLWQAVARGEVAPTYSLAERAQLPLGGTVPVVGTATVPERVGAVAAFAVPDVDLVADRGSAAAYGAVPRTGVLVAAPGLSVAALRRAVTGVVGPGEVVVARPEPAAPSAVPKGRPATYRDLYVQSAGRCRGLSWTVLAAIGQVESGHGRNNGPSSAGALGPMQFLPSTWATYGVDGDGNGTVDIGDPYDAVPAAADYLCRYGAGRGGQALYDAVFAYNHLDSYVQTVLDLAGKYS